MTAQPNPDPAAHPNPFSPRDVSDAKWRAFAERYVSERRRGGGGESDHETKDNDDYEKKTK